MKQCDLNHSAQLSPFAPSPSPGAILFEKYFLFCYLSTNFESFFLTKLSFIQSASLYFDLNLFLALFACRMMIKCFVYRNGIKSLEVTNVCFKKVNFLLKNTSNSLVSQHLTGHISSMLVIQEKVPIYVIHFTSS